LDWIRLYWNLWCYRKRWNYWTSLFRLRNSYRQFNSNILS
jgi:hypothetical protein